ncbi:cytochrome c oxidase subunit 3 [Sediminibacterium sp. TEGAF015]|uniref:cytochrome c oxidase subunit 3 n=1 Tax=Sediminibacterium sp. TEGAF015 TaxID=575378 RepID=UPI00220134ED|nr:heme-copper oxidase subunit III [Sediminibacterium sp. TEGAF015]BDQ12474.1 cytochrome oxidase subunit III [Sediminibacterium sp. TEGAF015]
MSAIANETPKRIHPHKFTLWVAMGSIIMMFAGLTSAYIVKKNQSSWLEFDLPVVFMYSTMVIIASSVTIHLATKAFKAREMARYRTLITATALLGVLFMALQVLGFMDLEARNIALTGAKSNSAASFLLVITGLHMLHVLGGVIALLVMFIKAYVSSVKNYSSLSIELVGTYWHFVDILWIYLFIFYNWIG